jgi:hypothetical protein
MTQGGEGFSFNSSDCKDEEMDDKTAIYMQVRISPEREKKENDEPEIERVMSDVAL